MSSPEVAISADQGVFTLYGYSQNGEEEGQTKVQFDSRRIMRNKKSKNAILIDEDTFEIEDYNATNILAAKWSEKDKRFRLIGKIVMNYGMAAIYFNNRRDADEMVKAIQDRRKAEGRISQRPRPAQQEQQRSAVLQQEPIFPAPMPIAPTLPVIPTIPVIPTLPTIQVSRPPEIIQSIPRPEERSISNSGSIINEPVQQYFLLTIRQVRIPVSVHPTRPTLEARTSRLDFHRSVKLQPKRPVGTYEPEGGLYNMRILRSDVIESDVIEFFFHADSSQKKDQDICRRSYSVRQLLDSSELGKVYYLALEGNGAHKLSYNNTVNEQTENYHYTKQYPFELEFSVMLTNRTELLAIQDFEVERQLNIQAKQHGRDRSGCMLVPNRYGVDYDIGEVGHQMLMKYREFMWPGKPKSVELDFTVEHVLRDFEVEESRSELSSSIMSAFYEGDRLRSAQRGFSKSTRLSVYMHLLNVEERYAILSQENQSIRGGNLQSLLSRPIDPADYQDFTDDYSEYGSKQPTLDKMLRIYLAVKEIIFDSKLFYCKELIPIADRLLRLVKYDALLRGNAQTVVICQATKLFVVFIQQVVPYYTSSVERFGLDLLHIRILVKEKMKEFNFRLNQLQIGLENLIAAPLLEVFSREHPELTYRIWDFLVYSQTLPSKQSNNVMPILAYTYLTFLESNQLTAFIPINQFMLSFVHNLNSVLPCQHVRDHLADDVAKSLKKFTSRDEKIAKLAKIKYVRKFLKCTEPTISIPRDEIDVRSTQPITERAIISAPRSTNSSTYSFDSRPNLSFCSPIRVVHLFLSKVSLGYNMSHQPFNISIKFQSQSSIRVTEGCPHRTIYLNYYAQSKPTPAQPLLSIITIENDAVQLQGQIDFTKGYHKDAIYRVNVPFAIKKLNFTDQQIRNDAADSIVECTFVLESQRTSTIIKPSIRYEKVLAGKLLDYDLDSDNALVKATTELEQLIERIKHPLDEFGRPYESLKVGSIIPSESDWIVNSRMGMQQIKTAFRLAFLSAEDKPLQMVWSTIFKDFSVREECNSFEFGRFLLSLVVNCKASRKQKLGCLFDIATSFQNLSAKEVLSFESIQSLKQELYLRCQYANPQPYYTKETGRIVSGFLEFREKAAITSQVSTANQAMSRSLMPVVAPTRIDRKDITSLLRTWQYLTMTLLKTADLMLGDHGQQTGLILLKSLLDWETHSNVISHRGCRLQIIYEISNKRFTWVGEFDEKFKLLQRGERTLNQYPPVNEINDPRSEAELLYNCENILPLSGRRIYSRADFNRIVRSDALLNYLLCCSIDPTTRLEQPPFRTPETSLKLLIDGQQVEHFSINQPNKPNSLPGVSKEYTLNQLQKMIVLHSKKDKLAQIANCQFDRYTLEDTSIYDKSITFGELQKLAMQSSVVPYCLIKNIIEMHFKTLRKETPTIEFYAVRRSNNFQERWERCTVLNRQQSSFVLVNFINGDITDSNSYLVPKYEIRGPGFLPAEPFYNLIGR